MKTQNAKLTKNPTPRYYAEGNVVRDNNIGGEVLADTYKKGDADKIANILNHHGDLMAAIDDAINLLEVGDTFERETAADFKKLVAKIKGGV